MKKIIVHNGQNMIDICEQEYGSVAALVQLAKDNNLGVDADLEAGQVLVIDQTKIINAEVVKYLVDRKIKINTWSKIETTPDNALINFNGAVLVNKDGRILTNAS